MPTQFLMLPPQNPTTRAWGARLATAVPELEDQIRPLGQNWSQEPGLLAGVAEA